MAYFSEVIKPYGIIGNIHIVKKIVTRCGDISYSHGCSSLKLINLSNGVEKIGLGAFALCKCIKSINIPNSVIIIEDLAFLNCDSLKSVNVFTDDFI